MREAAGGGRTEPAGMQRRSGMRRVSARSQLQQDHVCAPLSRPRLGLSATYHGACKGMRAQQCMPPQCPAPTMPACQRQCPTHPALTAAPTKAPEEEGVLSNVALKRLPASMAQAGLLPWRPGANDVPPCRRRAAPRATPGTRKP